MATKKSQTLKSCEKWQGARVSLYVAKYLAPVLPATVISLVNWEEWFAQTSWSLPYGLATLIIAILSTVIGITKKDKLVETKVSPIFFIALIMSIWGIAFLFLANIMQEVAYMLLWTCLGILASATADEVNTQVVEPRIEEYKTLIVENGLSKKQQAKIERQKKAEQEAKEFAENYQAVE